MTKFVRIFLVAALAIGSGFAGAGIATADIEDAQAENMQEGDNETRSDQEGSAESGDAVGGQVVGIVSSGDASVDATNVSEDVDVVTGDAEGENSAASFVGLNVSEDIAVVADIDNAVATNLQEGDNDLRYSQAAEAVSGDGVGGQVIGAVTSPGGSADIVAANTSRDVDIETGDADSNNALAAFVGLNTTATGTAVRADSTNAAATNLQEGDNEARVSQSSGASSGDAGGGSVIGAVAAGDVSIDATNLSQDVDVITGDAEAANARASFVGLNIATTTVVLADIFNAAAVNLQEGDNEARWSQNASAGSGDAVAGQVAGAVTTSGGSAEAVLDNTSRDVDVESGESEFSNRDSGFVGLTFGFFTLIF
jgi:hypothetical protein